MKRILFLIGLLALSAVPALAQRVITQDEVNEIASRMYCPVCENIPLSDCGTPTCIQWKDEIFQQLREGQSAQAIIDDFVARYGQHVVGIPQDPGLRALSLLTPWLLTFIVIGLGVATFLKWNQRTTDEGALTESVAPDTDPAYRQMLERDLK